MVCDGSHEHSPWGVSFEDGEAKFATAEERVYPYLLAQRISTQVTKKLESKFPALSMSRRKGAIAQDNQILSGKQPRGHKSTPQVPEYIRIKTSSHVSEEDIANLVESKEVQRRITHQIST